LLFLTANLVAIHPSAYTAHSVVEAELDHVAIVNDVVLALDAILARRAGLGGRAELGEAP